MRTTVSLPDELAEYVDENHASADESNAQAVRNAIRHARELEDEIASLETLLAEKESRITDLETELDRVKNEKRLILEEREEHTQLVRAVEQDQSIQEKKAQASIVERAKWWVTGMPSDEDE